MSTTTSLLQHPLHVKHPLKPEVFREDIPRLCHLCDWLISADGYTCEECRFYVHRECAEAPPQIDLHPLHTDHPLTLIHRLPPFISDVCHLCASSHDSLFRCEECDFNLDIRCALSTLLDRGGAQGKTLKQINLPLHPHKLISFSVRLYFTLDNNCVICKASVDTNGYRCTHRQCKFLIHKRCVPDLYYTDGTKAPQVYHRHPLETFLGEETSKRRCVKCGSKASSGEFIGCASCGVFCCRDCVQVPEIIQYPHHPDHNLVLLINCSKKDRPLCDSCLVSLECDLSYGCPLCEFFVDVGCALHVLSYCEEGMNTKIKLSWQERELLLCHGTKDDRRHCFCCEDNSAGPMYACKDVGGEIVLHKRCTEIESTIIHPHHPDHSLTICNETDHQSCGACSETIFNLKFFCELCAFYLHAKCAARFPTRKHYLHEHELLHLEEAPFCECNRCGTSTNASIYRCVPCDLNLHEECMDLPPQVVNTEVHRHELTLHETYIEDDSGKYYCDNCEQSRDVRLGAYVCLQCSARWVYHIKCVFPELQTVYEKKSQTSIIRRFKKRIGRKDEEVRAAEVKLEGMKRELDQLIKERDDLIKECDELISGEVHYESATVESATNESV